MKMHLCDVSKNAEYSEDAVVTEKISESGKKKFKSSIQKGY